MTKLEAVRQILSRNGLRPSSALDATGPSDMHTAEEFLDEEELAVQARGWHYNTLKDVEIGPVLFAITNAAWTDATKTLTQTGAFEDATVGQTLSITAGAVVGEYVVATVVSDNAVTLETDISTGGDIASGIVGVAVDNKIVVPSSAIHIDTFGVDKFRDFTQNGGRLYDLDNNVDLFEEAYKFTYIDRKEWGCIPFEYREYIMLRAALRWSEHAATAQYGSIKQALQRAEARVLTRNNKLTNLNVFNTSQASRMRGFRSGMGFRESGSTRFWS